MGEWKTTQLKNICQIKPPKKEAKGLLLTSDVVSFVPMNNLHTCSKSIELNSDILLGCVSKLFT